MIFAVPCFGVLLGFFVDDLTAGWMAAGTLWYALLAAGSWAVMRQVEAEQRRVLPFWTRQAWKVRRAGSQAGR